MEFISIDATAALRYWLSYSVFFCFFFEFKRLVAVQSAFYNQAYNK